MRPLVRVPVAVRSGTAPAGATGCPPPRMSSALGCAQGSPLISLRRAPGSPSLESARPSTREQPRVSGSGRRGALRSEIKEERRAQPASGDIRGAERPVGLISRTPSCENANVRNGPMTVALPKSRLILELALHEAAKAVDDAIAGIVHQFDGALLPWLEAHGGA
jgi:hypothetical protein